MAQVLSTTAAYSSPFTRPDPTTRLRNPQPRWVSFRRNVKCNGLFSNNRKQVTTFYSYLLQFDCTSVVLQFWFSSFWLTHCVLEIGFWLCESLDFHLGSVVPQNELSCYSFIILSTWEWIVLFCCKENKVKYWKVRLSSIFAVFSQQGSFETQVSKFPTWLGLVLHQNSSWKTHKILWESCFCTSFYI